MRKRPTPENKTHTRLKRLLTIFIECVGLIACHFIFRVTFDLISGNGNPLNPFIKGTIEVCAYLLFTFLIVCDTMLVITETGIATFKKMKENFDTLKK